MNHLSQLQQQLLGTFFEESFENVEHLEAGLLSLEEGGHEHVIHDVFRAAHSIKGGAGSFGLHAVTELAHAMETLLDKIRSGELVVTSSSSALLLESVDMLRRQLVSLRDGVAFDASARDRLVQALLGAASARQPKATTHPAAAQSRGYRIAFSPSPEILGTGNEPLRLLRELSRLGQLSVSCDASKLPRLAELDPEVVYLSFEAELKGEITKPQVEEVFAWVEGDAEVKIDELVEQAAEPAAALESTVHQPVAPAAAQRPEAEASVGSIRVSVDKIDLLMNMVGELVITQSILGELEGDGPVDAQRLARLREGLSELARNTRSLQESVMRLRSMPIGVVFNRFPRLVRDLGRQLDKDVELRVTGQNTELDKTVLERLGDPLVHLVRNSLDHGLESGAERRAAGKPERGVMELRAFHRGGDIVVEVCDDGRGINRERVLAKARERGLVAPDATPTDAEICELIFAPGFSTAQTVSDVSGRGVGMDVVKGNIKALGGDVTIDSVPGRGTRVSLRLPLTLAIIDGQLIRVVSHTYVVPLLSIVESLQIEKSRISRYQGRHEVYRLRDELIPMLDLAELLGLKRPMYDYTDRLLVIVEADGKRIGLVVDELLAQQQVVVKSLETNYGHVEGLAGATILGDGSVSFILDVAAVGRIMKGAHPARAA